MNEDIKNYHEKQIGEDRHMCDELYDVISQALPQAENKVWHAHPVWFLEGNPIVGYSKLKDSVRVLFWSGQSFDEPGLAPEGTFKAAEVRYTDASQIDRAALERYLKKAVRIQWDYKSLMKNKGRLERKQV